jgi:hypothetical protein
MEKDQKVNSPATMGELFESISARDLGEVLPLTEFISILPRLKYPLVIVGPSGIGKTWLGNQVAGVMARRSYIDVDTLGFVNDNEEWEINVDKVPDADIYSGWGIGMRAIGAKAETIVFPVPFWTDFTAVNKAKFVEGRQKRLSPGLLSYFEMHSKLTQEQYFKYILSKLAIVKRDLKENQKLFVVSKPKFVDDQNPKVKGWFA